MCEDNLMHEDGELVILQFTNTFLLSLSMLRRVSVMVPTRTPTYSWILLLHCDACTWGSSTWWFLLEP